MRYFIFFWQYTPTLHVKYSGSFAMAWSGMPTFSEVNRQIATYSPTPMPQDQIQVLSMFELQNAADYEAWLGK